MTGSNPTTRKAILAGLAWRGDRVKWFDRFAYYRRIIASPDPTRPDPTDPTNPARLTRLTLQGFSANAVSLASLANAVSLTKPTDNKLKGVTRQ